MTVREYHLWSGEDPHNPHPFCGSIFHGTVQGGSLLGAARALLGKDRMYHEINRKPFYNFGFIYEKSPPGEPI